MMFTQSHELFSVALIKPFPKSRVRNRNSHRAHRSEMFRLIKIQDKGMYFLKVFYSKEYNEHKLLAIN